MWPWCLLALLLLLTRAAGNDVLRIAGVFEDVEPPELQSAFLSAVKAINQQTAEQMVMGGVLRPALSPVIVTVGSSGGFKSALTLCSLVEDGVAGVIGPAQSASTDIVRSVCDHMKIPQIVINWDPSPPVPDSYQVNLHPYAALLSHALADVLRELKWRSYTVLYQGEESLVRLRGVLQERDRQDPAIAIRQLSPDGDYRALLKDLGVAGETHLVLDADLDVTLQVLHQAKEVKFTGVYKSFFITSLDVMSLNLAQLRGVGANITMLSLFGSQERLHGSSAGMLSNTTTSAALMHDAVNLLAAVLFKEDASRPLRMARLTCGSAGWKRGPRVRDALYNMRYDGVSGNIALDAQGRRVNFSLEVLELSASGSKLVGIWTPAGGFSSTRTKEQDLEETQSILQGRHLIVSSRIGPPYLSKKPRTVPPRVGNDRYEGYSMDLITKIADKLHFTFEFQLAEDGQYGNLDEKTGKWNGLVGDLIYGRADLAICDLTITEQRQSVVDFTMPFMTLGISILFKKTENKVRSLFSFMDPFTVDVWIYVATAFLGVSLIFYIVARAAPHEWRNPNPRDSDCAELENEFSLGNIFWYTGSALLGGGGEEMPRAVSTRIMAGMWAFFKLIMIASYTANLAAFLTSSRMETPIQSIQDLAKSRRIKYGTYDKGSTAGFFRSSNDTLYQRMWLVMKQARPNVFTGGNAEGVERVKKGKGNYAFFMESVSIEYETALDCDLRKVGGELDSKGYGIAMPRDSPFRTAISGAVLTLQEHGNLSALKDEWWKAPKGKECPKEEEGANTKNAELGILDVGGVFLVVGCGMFFAVFANVVEFLWNCHKIAIEEKITPSQAFVSEAKLVSHLCSDVKPVRQRHLPQQPDVCQPAD